MCPHAGKPADLPTAGGENKEETRSRLRGWADALAGLLVAAAYFLVALWSYPRADVFEFDPDEGNYVLMARMVDRGHALYSEIWSDQPPLFTYGPMWWCRATGWDVDNVRLLVLLATTGLVFAVYDSLRLIGGHRAGLAAAALLPCSMYFLRLSVSAMAGLPAIALATLCIWSLLRWWAGGNRAWIVAGGLLMGLALMTKLFVGFLVPLTALWLLLVRRGREAGPARWLTRVWPAALWLLCVVVAAGAVLLCLVPPAQIEQLYRAHLLGRGLFDDYDSRGMLLGNIVSDWELFAMAAIGCLQVWLRRRAVATVFPLWGLAAFVVLWWHSPVWYHHHLLLSVPVCAAGGLAVSDVVDRGWLRPRDWAAAGRVAARVATVVLLVLLVVGLASGRKRDVPRHVFADGDDHRLVLRLMRALAKPGAVVVADRQMYAARADLAVPPDLCVTSEKRLRSGDLTASEVVEQILRHDPQQIVLSRGLYRLRDQVMPAVAAAGRRYVPIYARRNFVEMYVRADVVDDPLAVLMDVVRKSLPPAAAYDYIGMTRLRRGEDQAAREAFGRAVEIDPTYPEACRHLAQMHMSAGDYARGLAILEAALKDAPKDRYAQLGRVYAWRRATCPDKVQRDGAEAKRVIDAVMRGQGGATPADLEILAAALAAQGRFDAAVATATRVSELARRSGAAGAVRRIERQLQAYRNRQPWLTRPQPPAD